VLDFLQQLPLLLQNPLLFLRNYYLKFHHLQKYKLFHKKKLLKMDFHLQCLFLLLLSLLV
jgi:hypothetical protein